MQYLSTTTSCYWKDIEIFMKKRLSLVYRLDDPNDIIQWRAFTYWKFQLKNE